MCVYGLESWVVDEEEEREVRSDSRKGIENALWNVMRWPSGPDFS